MELKTHGNESPQFVSNVVAAIAAAGERDSYLVQASSTSLLKHLREEDPALTLGYIVPFAFGVSAIPD